jgi:phage terminase small subunit
MKNEHGLTQQQERFAQEVASGKSQAEAYRIAYPRSAQWKQSTVHQKASTLMANGRVLERASALQRSAAEKSVLSAERTLNEVAMIAYADISGIVNSDGSFKRLHELGAETRAAVSSFKIDKDGVIEYRFWNKSDALEKAMKHLGLYAQDNKQASGGLRELFAALGGNVFGPVSNPAEVKDEEE